MEIKIKLGKEEITLDDNFLKIDESNLNEFMREYAGRYNMYQQLHAKAQALSNKVSDRYDMLYSSKFVEFKTNPGGSDKFVECKVRADNEVAAVAELCRIYKRNLASITGFLKSCDRAFESAKEMSYNLRKEMSSYPYSS